MLSLPFTINVIGPLLKIKDVVNLCESSQRMRSLWSGFLVSHAIWTWNSLEEQKKFQNDYHCTYDNIRNVSILNIGSELNTFHYQEEEEADIQREHFRQILSALPSKVKHLHLKGYIVESIKPGWFPSTLISLRLYLQKVRSFNPRSFLLQDDNSNPPDKAKFCMSTRFHAH